MQPPQKVDRRGESGLIADLRWQCDRLACHLLSDGVKLFVLRHVLGEGAYE